MTWVLRIAIFGVGAAATVIAITVGSIYELWYLCSDFVYVMLYPQLTCVVYFNDTNTYGSLTGFVVGLFFRLAGGDKYLKLKPLIKYPWYVEADNDQLFPYKTLSMLITFISIFIASFISNILFKKGLLPKGADIFKCVVNINEKYPKNNFDPVDMSSRTTITTFAGSTSYVDQREQASTTPGGKYPQETRM